MSAPEITMISQHGLYAIIRRKNYVLTKDYRVTRQDLSGIPFILTHV